MSEPIKVGDLVMVVRGHSCAMELIGGVPFKVEDIAQVSGWACNRCNAKGNGEIHFSASGHNVPKGTKLLWSRGRGYLPLAWLKRIPPIEELEREKLKEKLRELV